METCGNIMALKLLQKSGDGRYIQPEIAAILSKYNSLNVLKEVYKESWARLVLSYSYIDRERNYIK